MPRGGTVKVKRILMIVQDRADIGYGVFLSRAFSGLGVVVREAPLSREPHTHSPVRLAIAKAKRMSGLTASQHRRNCANVLAVQKEFRADLIIIIKCTAFPAEILRELHRTGAALVQMNTDHPHIDPGLKDPTYLGAIGEYDLVVTFARLLVPVYYQMGARRVVRLPFAHDPSIHRKVSLDPRERDIFTSPTAYLGAWGYFQQSWLEPLLPCGIKVFGGLWHHLPPGHPLAPRVNLHRGWGEEMAKVCAGASIIVSLIRAEHDCAHSMKTFEIPACGGFMVTNRTEEQLEFFREDQGAVYFSTRAELLEKADYYLKNDGPREKIKNAGTAAAAPHTYEARAKDLLSVI
jgi:spore maturation protein CgeB